MKARRDPPSRAVEHAGPVPVALWPQQQQRVALKGQGVGDWTDLGDDFQVLPVREPESGTVEPDLALEMAGPERRKARLRVTQDAPVTLALRQTHGLADEGEGGAAAPMTGQDRHPLELGEICEPADPQHTDRFVAIAHQQVRGAGKIVAVKLLPVGAALLSDVDEGADRCDLQEVVEGAGDEDPVTGSVERGGHGDRDRRARDRVHAARSRAGPIGGDQRSSASTPP